MMIDSQMVSDYKKILDVRLRRHDIAKSFFHGFATTIIYRVFEPLCHTALLAYY